MQNGYTYYVKTVASGIQLTDRLGAVQSLAPSERYGTHYLGKAGIDLAGTTTGGSEELRIDLTSWSSGPELFAGYDAQTHQYISIRSLSPPAADGQSYAKAQGGAGGGIEVGVPTAKLTATHTASAYVNAQTIDAGGDVSISSLSDGNVKAYTNNGAGGAIMVGEADSTTKFTNSSHSSVGANITIIAGNDFTLSAKFMMANDDVDCIVKGGGVISVALSEAYATIINDTKADVGQNASITANTVLLEAKVTSINADAYAESKTGGITGASTAKGYVFIGEDPDDDRNDDKETDGRSDLTVLISAPTSGHRTRIAGTEGVDIVVAHEGFTVDGHAYAVFYGLSFPVDKSGEPKDLSATIDGNPLVTVTAGPRLPQTRLQKPAGFDDLALYVKADGPEDTRIITWDSDVVILGRANPELIVNSGGTIDKAVNVTVNGGHSSGYADPDHDNTFSVDDIANHGGQALFKATDGSITGPNSTRPTFEFSYTFGEVKIDNKSSLDMVINNIAVANTSESPWVELAAPAGNVSLTFNIKGTVTTTLVDIKNESASDIYFNGTVENPIGTTNVFNTGGDIWSKKVRDLNETDSHASLLRTNILDIEAADGNIGNSTARVNVDLVQSSHGFTQFFADAGQNACFDLKGRLRQEGISSFTTQVDSIQTGGDADVLLESAVKETTLGTAGKVRITINQATPAPPNYEYFAAYFRPDGISPPNTDLGLYGGGAVSTAATYDFRQLDRNRQRTLSGATSGSNLVMKAGTRLQLTRRLTSSRSRMSPAMDTSMS